MKKSFYLIIAFLLLIILTSCKQEEANGIPIVTLTGMSVGDTHFLIVFVNQGSTQVALGGNVIAGGTTVVNSYFDSGSNTWIGDGGTAYLLLIGIDMNDDLAVGNSGDYVATKTVEIDGDVNISLGALDFTLVP